ncbi:hypothetical protein BGZ60DRAFT_460550, partial [Tricladium varicosporioides]
QCPPCPGQQYLQHSFQYEFADGRCNFIFLKSEDGWPAASYLSHFLSTTL